MTSTDQPSSSSLFKLPPELRNEIYELALLKDQPIYISHNARLREPALLAINRQVRAEGLPLYYGVNTFALGHSTWTFSFFDKLGGDRIAMPRRLRAFSSRMLDFSGRKWKRHTRSAAVEWQRVWGEEMLKGEAILIPLFLGSGKEVEWVPFTRLGEWRVVKQNGDGGAIWVRKLL